MTQAAFKIADDMFSHALKIEGTDKWDTFLSHVPLILGVDKDTFLATFQGRKDLVAVAEASAAIAKKIEGYAIPKSLHKLVKIASDSGLALSLAFDKDSDTVTLVIGKPRKIRSTDGNVGATSRISAWQAYLRGVKALDTFRFERTDTGYNDTQRDVQITKRKNGGLAGYIMRNYPGSETTKILHKYGYSLD